MLAPALVSGGGFTPAELSAPYAAAWELYVFNMWREGVKHRGHRYSLDEAKAIQSFLAYDAARRKVGSRDFEKLTTYLQNRFASSILERMKRLEKQPK